MKEVRDTKTIFELHIQGSLGLLIPDGFFQRIALLFGRPWTESMILSKFLEGEGKGCAKLQPVHSAAIGSNAG